MSTAKRTATPPPSFTASRSAMQLVDAGVDFRVPFLRLRHAEQRVDLRVDHLQRAAVAQHADEDVGAGFAQRLLGFRPDALGHQRVGLAVGDHLPHQRQRLVGDAKAERRVTRGETRHAQDAHRVFGEGLRHMAQQARLEVALAAVGIDDVAGAVLRPWR